MGGTSTTADFGKEYTASEVESDIVPAVSDLLDDKSVQVTTVSGSSKVTLKTRTLSLEERQKLEDLLTSKSMWMILLSSTRVSAQQSVVR